MTKRPDVLLITVDHWQASMLGVAGHPVIQTPTLDQLARNGTRYTNAYSACPMCIPARRNLMTGTPSRTHGDRTFMVNEPMPAGLPTMAQTFRDAGYQAYAVGKLHVHPARDRIGFDDVILAEEGRVNKGILDDHDIFLQEQGYAGMQYAHGMSNNDYQTRPWHLPEYYHVTNWSTREIVRMIKRRDPTRPSFWYLSYNHPHPPLVPLQAYLDIYRDIEVDMPFHSKWSKDTDSLPFFLKAIQGNWSFFSENEIRQIRRAFYALCTHIDHQIRVIIGTLREELLLANTIIMITSDHGEMLGNHNLWAKRLFYEYASNIPMILIGPVGGSSVGYNRVDDRLVELADVMPTLLELADIPVPDTVEGLSMIGDQKRDYLYGENAENAGATRMVHDGRHKLIYYAVGNHIQLFDLENDPDEVNDLADQAGYDSIRDRLKEIMISEFYGSDMDWVKQGELVGVPDRPYEMRPRRGLLGQRGLHLPQPPPDPSELDFLELG